MLVETRLAVGQATTTHNHRYPCSVYRKLPQLMPTRDRQRHRVTDDLEAQRHSNSELRLNPIISTTNFNLCIFSAVLIHSKHNFRHLSIVYFGTTNNSQATIAPPPIASTHQVNRESAWRNCSFPRHSVFTLS